VRIVQGSASAHNGGAGRAALRLHTALLTQGLDSTFITGEADVRAANVITASERHPAWRYLKLWQESSLLKLSPSPNMSLRSPALVRGPVGRELLTVDADVIHLHWLGGFAASIPQIGNVLRRTPTVWTLHDLWVPSGTEHYGGSIDRRRLGYTRRNRPDGESGFDLDRMAWNRKRRHWSQPARLVAPSEWLANEVRSSQLCAEWPVRVIPNPLDTQMFRPIGRELARSLLGLPPSEPLILFSALGGIDDPRKGWDLLERALPQVLRSTPGLRIVTVGGSTAAVAGLQSDHVLPVGRVADDLTLAALYSAVDCVVVPSREDVLPQVATEAQACGTPVVGFRIGGLPDCVVDGSTGALAEPFDTDDLAERITWVVSQELESGELGRSSRDRAVRLWSFPVVVQQYNALYESALHD
jgi:glycosyltransferase involved in cell wall biosynthesis